MPEWEGPPVKEGDGQSEVQGSRSPGRQRREEAPEPCRATAINLTCQLSAIHPALDPDRALHNPLTALVCVTSVGAQSLTLSILSCTQRTLGCSVVVSDSL